MTEAGPFGRRRNVEVPEQLLLRSRPWFVRHRPRSGRAGPDPVQGGARPRAGRR